MKEEITKQFSMEREVEVKQNSSSEELNERCRKKKKKGSGFKKSHTIETKWKNSKCSEEDGPLGEPTVGTQYTAFWP